MMFKTIVLVCVFLLLNVGCSSSHDSKRINSLKKTLKNKLNKLKEDFQDELSDTEEKIRVDVTNDLPDMIQAALFELYKTGQMESISNQHSQEEIRTLKQHVNQLKTGMIQLRKQLKLTEKTHAKELKKISNELKKVQENYVLDKISSETECRCVENKNLLITSTVSLSNSTEVTTIAPVIKPTEDTKRFNHLLAVGREGLFYQFDLQNMTKTKLSLRGHHIADVTFDSGSRSIIWIQRRFLNISARNILSMNIDSKNITTLVSNILCFHLAADDGLLFYIVFNSRPRKYTIMRRRIDDYTDVATLKIFIDADARLLTLDPSEQRVFFALRAEIVQMNYDGQDLKVLKRRNWVTGLTFDPLQGVLYGVIKSRSIIKVDPWRRGQTGVELEQCEVVLVVEDAMYISDIVLDGDLVYTAGANGNIWVSNLKTNSTSIFSDITLRVIRLCLIP